MADIQHTQTRLKFILLIGNGKQSLSEIHPTHPLTVLAFNENMKSFLWLALPLWYLYPVRKNSMFKIIITTTNHPTEKVAKYTDYRLYKINAEVTEVYRD
ncbi:hypothetical protein [Photorhabdus heterorhabditis]|uniref:Uncharacterized protein n=1 Tax=Photorhabdus heterorhabditis TaxID=880156 RepID=A0A5B0X9Q1_9GAMM|nr:hypothetical protein [Photorhabdus heterorhabditis]KAA1195071.1 hypothetical protein F0L16_03325 [Photorhabdus heterorhabditis]